MSIIITTFYDKSNNNELVATLSFGKVEAHLYENTYLLDDLYDGYCNLCVSDDVFDIFYRHNAQKITRELNPKLISVIEKLFTSSLLYNRLNDETPITVDVSKDKNMRDLFADKEFQKLNT